MKEHKFVIIRTRKGDIVDCFSFMTPEYNNGNVLPKFAKPKKVADEINLHPYVGGMLEVELKQYFFGGNISYPVIEKVYFEKELVTEIEVFTEFGPCRTKEQEVRNED